MKVHSSILMILWGSYTGIHSSTWPSSSPRSRVQLSLHRWRQRCPPGWRGRSCSWCLWGSWVHHRHRRRTHSCHWSQATLEAAKSKFRITPSHCVIPSYSIMFHNIPWYFMAILVLSIGNEIRFSLQGSSAPSPASRQSGPSASLRQRHFFGGLDVETGGLLLKKG